MERDFSSDRLEGGLLEDDLSAEGIMEAVATEIAESFEPAMTEGKAAAATAAVTAAAGGHKCESIVGDLCVHGPFRENLCIPTSLQSQDYEVRRIVIGHRSCAAPHEMRYTTRAVDRSRLEASGDAIRMAGWSTQTTGKSPSQNPQNAHVELGWIVTLLHVRRSFPLPGSRGPLQHRGV